MERLTVPASLRLGLDDDAAEGLVEMFDQYHRLTSERYERRLAEETGRLRVEMHQGFGAVRQDVGNIRADIMKWSLLFWISQFAAQIGVLSYMLPHR